MFCGITATHNQCVRGSASGYTPSTATVGASKMLVWQFTGSTTFVLDKGAQQIEYLVVGGGGSGGGAVVNASHQNYVAVVGGGGGGGQLSGAYTSHGNTSYTYPLNMSVTVGGGGSPASQGSSSSFWGDTVSGGNRATAYQTSGLGFAFLTNVSSLSGNAGGAGALYYRFTYAGTTGVATGGFRSAGTGAISSVPSAAGGGGGGVGSSGSNGAVSQSGSTYTATGGSGGSAYASSITGTTVYYGGGGGGGASVTKYSSDGATVTAGSPGINAGAGATAINTINGSTGNGTNGNSATANYGGGGGGAAVGADYNITVSRSGGSGGSGIVIIRYPL